MGYYAQVENGTVVNVIVADSDFISSGAVGDPVNWIETDFPTNTNLIPLFRKNYANIGYTYDSERDAFIPPKPGDNYVLNELTCRWDPTEE